MPFTPEQRANLEDQFRQRAAEMGYKPKSAKYKNAELEFFVGAMATQLVLTGETQADPKWAIMLMSGRSVTQSAKTN